MSHHSINKIALQNAQDLPFVIQEWMRSVNRAFASHGTYTPTLTNTTNLSASTAYECTYQQIQNEIIVYGKVDVDPTAVAATTQLRISLPHVAEFTGTGDLSGVATCPAIGGQTAALYADTTNQEAIMEWVSADAANRTMHFTFSYLIDH